MFATIHSINLDRGYCFASPNGGGRDVFCHCKAFMPPLVFGEHLVGERVDVDTIDTPRGMEATSVRPMTFERV